VQNRLLKKVSGIIQRYQAGLTDILNIKK